MWSSPPNARCVAEEGVVATDGRPVRWAVFVTAAAPAEVIAYYTRAMGRPPDADGGTWREPRQEPLFTAAVYPADRRDALPPGARGQVPNDARAVIYLTRTAAGSPLEERRCLLPSRDNVLPDDLSPAALLQATTAGRLFWAAAEHGPVFQAAGSTLHGLLSGEVLWVALGRTGNEYSLTVTSGDDVCRPPVRQKDGWFRRCELGRLWLAVERSVGGTAV